MKLVHGLLNYQQPWALPDVYLFTGNPIATASGRLVMGRGAAKVVRDAYPRVDMAFAIAVRDAVKVGRQLAWVKLDERQAIGWFQVKHHWQESAVLELIYESAKQLAAMASERPHLRFHINAPGVGNGRLQWEDIAPLLFGLPDNVLVYYVPDAR